MTNDSSKNTPTLITLPSRKRRRIVAWVVIIVVIVTLVASFFIQPNNGSENNQGDIADGLLRLVQGIVSFVVLLASIAEVTGINVRELFISRSAETNVEDFPFYVIRDFDELLEHLFPDPKTPLLADRKIKYIPQISGETDLAFREKGMLLIRGRSKTGKTREACELLQRWWYSGPTVLVARSHVGLYPPFKIPENLPIRNLVIFFDDIDMYLGDNAALKRLDETIKFFQDISHGHSEIKVIATSRQEDESWKKLQFDKTQSPWDKFEVVQLASLSTEKAQDVIVELSKLSQIEIEQSFVKTLAEKNNGTFLNLVLTFRHWLSQDLKKVTSEHIRTFEGALKNTWRQRYNMLAVSHPEVRPIYAAIDLMQTHNIPLQLKLIIVIATEMAMGKGMMSFLGLYNRFGDWADMSPLFNWYRDTNRRERGWIIILLFILLSIYLGMYSFLTFTPGMTQVRFFERLSIEFSFQLAILLPLWLLLIPFILHSLSLIIHNYTLRKNNKTLEYLLATEVPTRKDGLSPYEGQFEGNGQTNNWNIQNYIGEVSEKMFQHLMHHRLIDRYTNLADELRLAGELSGAREIINLAIKLSNEHPVPFFILGKIALDEKEPENAVQYFSKSHDLYKTSNNAARPLEMIALCHLILRDYEKAEEAANRSLKLMPSLINARWISDLLESRKSDINGWMADHSIASSSKEILLDEIYKEAQAVTSTPKDKLEDGTSIFQLVSSNSEKAKEKKISISSKIIGFGIIFSFSFLLFAISLRYSQLLIDTNLIQSINIPKMTTMFFPNSPSAIAARGNFYSINGAYEKAIADYTEALRIDPEYAFVYTDRGSVYYQLGEYEKAIADYNESLRIDPEYADAYNSRGVAYTYLNEYEKAIADYNEAIRIDPDFANAYNGRGAAYTYLNEYENAIADYNEAIRIDPEFVVAYYNRGAAYTYLNEYENAIADYSEAIRIDPDFANAYNNRGAAYTGLNEHEKAIADYNEAIRIDPDFAVAYYNRGAAYTDLNEYEKAIADYSEAIRIDPDFAVAYYNRGAAYTDLNEYEKAIADYSEAIRIDPDFANAYYNRGAAYRSLGKNEKADADSKRYQELTTNP